MNALKVVEDVLKHVPMTVLMGVLHHALTNARKHAWARVLINVMEHVLVC